MPDQGSPKRAKLRWRCRRGMRELDVLLLRYLEEHYAQASIDERQAFGAFLELQDPEIFRYLLGPDPELEEPLRNVVESIRGCRD